MATGRQGQLQQCAWLITEAYSQSSSHGNGHWHHYKAAVTRCGN